MFRIVSTKPKTKKELRRERVDPDVEMNRTAIFSIYFTRSLLAFCLVMLGTLFGMKVSDYYHERYWMRQEERLFSQTKLGNRQIDQEVVTSIPPAIPSPATPAQPQPPAVGANVLTSPPLTGVAPQAPAPQVGTVISEPTVPTLPPGYQPQPQPQPMTSPSNANFDQQLATLRAEREMLSRQFEKLNPGTAPDTLAQPRPSQEIGGGANVDQSPARQILPEEMEKELHAAKTVTPADQRILDAPALARVAEYNSDWRFVVLDGGSARNIGKGQQFAVRRGAEIICIVQVSDVDVNTATADLQGRAKNDPKAEKPRPGDDVIGYPLF